MVTITIETETNDKHVNQIRKEFEKCQKMDDDDSCRVYVGSNIDKLLVFFNTGIGGICLENIVDIDCTDVSIFFIMQQGGYTHTLLYEEVERIIIKFKK